jgi:hypothetical protein
MNPVTRSLLKKVPEAELHHFVEGWDELEALVVQIFRQKSVTFHQQEIFFGLQTSLLEGHAKYKAELDGFWPTTKVKGDFVRMDPFLQLLRVSAAREFVENWEAMKTLPAAREALNQMLMTRAEKRPE